MKNPDYTTTCDTTRTYPRTLVQAFGPHTSQSIWEPVPTWDRLDWIIVGASVAVCVVLPALMLLRVI